MRPLPHEAKVVVIGGGIAGCSAAYHLAENGWDTVLIERAGDVIPHVVSVDLKMRNKDSKKFNFFTL